MDALKKLVDNAEDLKQVDRFAKDGGNRSLA
jgi:hypothetical protein